MRINEGTQKVIPIIFTNFLTNVLLAYLVKSLDCIVKFFLKPNGEKKRIEKSTVVTKLNCFKNFNAIHEISSSQIKDCDLTAIQIVKKNLQFHKI